MIDGIVSGKLLLYPKMMYSSRGSAYLIAKMQAYGYRQGRNQTPPLYADVIAFDASVIAALADCRKGEEISIAGVITVKAERVDDGRIDSVLKVTALRVLKDYESGQTMGRGRLFNLLGVS